MATIFEMVQARKQQFTKDPTRATQSMALAIAAVKEGMKSKAWEYYMAQFIDKASSDLSVAQLARLKATDETEGDPVMDRHRAYLVANAMCGPSTVNDLDRGIQSIDDGVGTFQCSREVFDCDTTTIGVPKPSTRRPGKSTKYKKTGKH